MKKEKIVKEKMQRNERMSERDGDGMKAVEWTADAAKDKLVEDLGCEIQKSKPAFVLFIQRWSQERYKGELRNSWLKAARKKEENVKDEQHFKLMNQKSASTFRIRFHDQKGI